MSFIERHSPSTLALLHFLPYPITSISDNVSILTETIDLFDLSIILWRYCQFSNPTLTYCACKSNGKCLFHSGFPAIQLIAYSTTFQILSWTEKQTKKIHSPMGSIKLRCTINIQDLNPARYYKNIWQQNVYWYHDKLGTNDRAWDMHGCASKLPVSSIHAPFYDSPFKCASISSSMSLETWRWWSSLDAGRLLLLNTISYRKALYHSFTVNSTRYKRMREGWARVWGSCTDIQVSTNTVRIACVKHDNHQHINSDTFILRSIYINSIILHRIL